MCYFISSRQHDFIISKTDLFLYNRQSVSSSMSASKINWMALILASFAGIGTDFILFYNKITSNEVACPLGGSCNFVNNSVFSEMFGIPVSVFGLLAFAFFLVVSWTAWHRRVDEKTALLALVLVAGGSLLGIAYFVYLMIFVLEAICSWCMLSHLIMLSIFLYAAYNLYPLLQKNSRSRVEKSSRKKSRGK